MPLVDLTHDHLLRLRESLNATIAKKAAHQARTDGPFVKAALGADIIRDIWLVEHLVAAGKPAPQPTGEYSGKYGPDLVWLARKADYDAQQDADGFVL